MSELWALAVRTGAALRDALFSDAFCGLLVIVAALFLAFQIVRWFGRALARRG